eukprot:1161539-Pelagomonas_calceolata.AAC.14
MHPGSISRGMSPLVKFQPEFSEPAGALRAHVVLQACLDVYLRQTLSNFWAKVPPRGRPLTRSISIYKAYALFATKILIRGHPYPCASEIWPMEVPHPGDPPPEHQHETSFLLKRQHIRVFFKAVLLGNVSKFDVTELLVLAISVNHQP